MAQHFNPALSRRGLLTLTGSLAAAGALAACGGNTGRSGDGSSGAASGGAGGSASSGSGGKATLSQWYHQYGEAGTQQAVQKYAKDYSEATVNVTWKAGDYEQPLGASLLTDSAPDVFEYGNGPTIDMIKGGQVADLTDVFGDAKADFNPALIERVTYDGKIWAIPQVMDMQLLIYRKSMLSAAGVTPPKTIDELLAAAKKLTSAKVKGLFVGNDGGASLLGGPMLWSAGSDYLTPEGAFGFDGDAAATALGRLHELFTSGSLLLGAPKDWYDAAALTQGLTAMQFTGLWTLPDVTKALGDDFGVLPWPASTGGKQSVPIGAYGSCVSAKSKNLDAAKAYAKWLWVDSTDRQLDFAQSYGFHVPARVSVAAKADKLKSGPAAEAVGFATQYGHAQTPILWTPKCSTAFSDMMTRIVKDGADPKAEIAKLKPIVEAEVKRVKG